MNEISVRVKVNGMLLACRPYRESDGYVFRCAECEEVCCRVSFGIMNGFWRCLCGNEIEIVVDGQIVDLREFNTEPSVSVGSVGSFMGLDRAPFHPKPRTVVNNDEEFLKACGISAEEVRKP